MKIELGKTVQDVITGFKGVVTGRVEYLTGCNQCLIAPRVGVDGAYKDSQWFDEDRLEIQKAALLTLPRTTAGFDKAAPKR